MSLMIVQKSDLSQAIARAVNFLDENQLYNGEFRSYRSDNEALQGSNLIVDSCTFVTSCILYSLRFLNDSGPRPLKRTGLEFLVKQMKAPGLWRYFSSGYPISIDLDLDDTACAAFLLRDVHPDIRGGRNYDVILGNRNEDGLFFTWLQEKSKPNDVDSVVNANVLLYLGDREETRAVSDYLNTIIAEGREAGSYYYYLDDLAFYYAVSRAYFNRVSSLQSAREHVISRTLSRQRGDGSFGNELLTALAICSLLNYSYRSLDALSRGAENLINTQRADGSWARTAYYAGPLPPEPYAAWYGSEELTTGFCLEALARFRDVMPEISFITREDAKRPEDIRNETFARNEHSLGL
jgi:hypothetical protein